MALLLTRPCARQLTTMASSPTLPSPSTFLPSLGLKSGSRAAQAPSGTTTGISSAAHLLPGLIPAEEPKKKARKPNTAAQSARTTTEKKQRRKKPKSEAIVIDSDDVVEQTSAYFAPKERERRAAQPYKPAAASCPAAGAETMTAAAPPRRRDWTPVKDTSVPSPAARLPLSELMGNFRYSGQAATMLGAFSPPPAGQRATPDEPKTKKRRIELAETAPTKTKAAKTAEKPPKEAKKKVKELRKKPRTVTEAAMAAYQPSKTAADVPMVSEFFAPKKADGSTSAADEGIGKPAEKIKKPRKPRVSKPKAATDDLATNATTEKSAKAPKKPAVPRAKKPKAAKLNEADFLPPLYTPERAHKQAQRQDFLFGTSSQLVMEESPTFIKQIQTALEESSEMTLRATQAEATATQISPKKGICEKVVTAPHGTYFSVEQAEKELWAVAARDWKGGLLREKSGLGPRRHKPAQPADSAPTRPPDADPDVQITEKDELTKGTGEGVSVRRPKPADDAESGATSRPPAADAVIEIMEKSIPAPEKQDDAEAVDSFIDIDDIEDEHPPSPPTPSPPRRRASASPTPVRPLRFEIPESPSQSLRQSDEKGMAIAHNAALKPTDEQWGSRIKGELFLAITTAVKSSSSTRCSSTNPAKPSWLQKILLYDPIVLEDLTAWLNARDVKISVLRKETKAASKKRKKTDNSTGDGGSEGTVQVKEELKEWMVQKWCEERSICCLWKEGLRGGVRSRY